MISFADLIITQRAWEIQSSVISSGNQWAGECFGGFMALDLTSYGQRSKTEAWSGIVQQGEEY